MIKETLAYLRGRERPEVVRLIEEGLEEGGVDATTVTVYPSEAEALEAELTGEGALAAGIAATQPRVVVLFCHEERDQVYGLLGRLGAVPLDPTVAVAAPA